MDAAEHNVANQSGAALRRTDMKRLTERKESGVINVRYATEHETAIHRLAAIEDILGDEYDLERLKEAVKLIDKLERK